MSSPTTRAPLDRARAKAYRRLLPLLFICYVIAYVDRSNVGFAKLTMMDDLPGFDNAVFGYAMGTCFFIGYFLLEIPGTLIVERWSARKWICRIMVSWGLIAALTAFVATPLPVVPGVVRTINQGLGWTMSVPEFQFYGVRFLLGLAEAGFFPGVIVYLTHWFTRRDRAKALAWFFVATPIAQFIGPLISRHLLRIGVGDAPEVMGLVGWQWVFIAWGLPAVVLGMVVLVWLTDRPSQAGWLEPDERDALELELKRDKEIYRAAGHMKVIDAFRNPKVLLLAAVYFFVVTGNYGIEFFMPTIFNDWYGLKPDDVALLVIIPPIGSLLGQLFIGWNSDRLQERRLHTALPIYMGAVAVACTLLSEDRLWLTVLLFTVAMTGLKAYLPAFWSLPSLFLTEAAAAGSIGLINSVGNLGGALGPAVLGQVKTITGSFRGGLLFLSVSMTISATIVLLLGLGRRVEGKVIDPSPMADPVADPA